MPNASKKKRKWCRWYHALVRHIACLLLSPYIRWKYGVKVEKFREGKKRPYLILYNHQTAFDQFFVGMAFFRAIYYVASEDLFSNGAISSLLRFLVAPIPIKKQAVDIAAIRTCLQVAREGGTIALAPEGNRTYSGKTEYMRDSIAPLARKIGLPILLFRIEGGYGVHPRWSDSVRAGRMRARVAEVIEPEEYATLSDAELFARIRGGLFVNEAESGGLFRGRRRAEYIERVLYVCPTCGLTRFASHKNSFTCLSCGKETVYGEDKILRGVGHTAPFSHVTDWYAYQAGVIAALDPAAHTEAPLYTDRVRLSQVYIGKKKTALRKESTLRLYGDRITFDEGEDELCFSYDSVYAMAVLGRNKLNIYCGHDLYQVKGDARFNAVKYVNLFFRYKDIRSEDEHGKFLGL